jgi:large subunit ribosomal protein L10
MKSRDEKKKEVEQLKETLAGTQHVFLTAFEKLTVQQDFELRKAVRGAGGRYQVVKNTLAGIAAEGTPAQPILSGLSGVNSIAYTTTDPVALAKVLTKYAKENTTFTFKAGVVEGRVFDVAGIGELAAMPSRDELFAKLLYLINAPAQGLVTAMNGVGRNLAVVVDQGVKENKFAA